MYKITLVGPETTCNATTDSLEAYNQFIKWLREYNPIKGKLNTSAYPISSENRMIACRAKARRIGITVQ